MYKEPQQKTGLQHSTVVWYGGSCINKHMDIGRGLPIQFPPTDIERAKMCICKPHPTPTPTRAFQ